MKTEIVAKSKRKRGGYRKGSGRKSTWNNIGHRETTNIRVPKTLTQKLMNIAHILNNGKTIPLVEESNKMKKLRELIKTEREQIKAMAKKRGMLPQNMPTWKNINRLLERFEEILNS
jgi:hypothetical protein